MLLLEFYFLTLKDAYPQQNLIQVISYHFEQFGMRIGLDYNPGSSYTSENYDYQYFFSAHQLQSEWFYRYILDNLHNNPNTKWVRFCGTPCMFQPFSVYLIQEKPQTFNPVPVDQFKIMRVSVNPQLGKLGYPTGKQTVLESKP